jgi:hypothetical protein
MPLAFITAVPADGHAGLQQWRGDIGGYCVWRLVTPAVAVQISAQSRHSRMLLTISVRFCSPRSAALSALRAWTQSLSVSMAAASRPASTLNVRG